MDGNVRRLNIGAGNFCLGEDGINHDLRKHREEIDITFDLNKFPYPLKDNDYDFIRAYDVLEHLDNIIPVMDEFWRILKPNCEIELKLCGKDNPNRYKDVTHTGRFFDEDSLDLFDPDTERGKELSYYTDKKWRIVWKRMHRDNVIMRLIPRK